MLLLYRDDGCHQFQARQYKKTVYDPPMDVGELHASGNAESRLKALMLNYVGKMISGRSSFQFNYALLQ